MVASGPAGPRRRLGAELRRLRTGKGLHLDAVAHQLRCSASKISRLETGKGIPKPADVRALIRLYDVTGDAEREMLLRLVRESRTEGWWQTYTEGVAPERFFLDAPGRYAALETDAVGLRSFDLSILNGVLQTEDYARAVMTAQLPRRSSEEIDQLVEMRMRRQEALHRPVPLRLDMIVDESALARVVGSRSVMAAQVRWLLDLMDLPTVSIRLVAFDAGIHRAHMGHFVILEIPDDLGSDVVYFEGHAGESFLDGPSEVDAYDDVFAEVSGLALDARASRAAVRRYLDDYAPRGKAQPYDRVQDQ
ncbi:helix-turn-helix domain-containing protein [Pseudonocardia charpentierae]|uniref:Helix-turn-helix transcriptional regulator n=1 Tax=Pseudonocardia charpentierae TaxID=3075545 RepID=A0ABU2NGB6_9PSEU|nr:helix-turn-helix transcriptional regulator [Pseudonocardia sp. DSM 45834]MDT0352513.1 helix-turn-helix transcriptional regulator [Pseudonocardia sp. DSM 45834]